MTGFTGSTSVLNSFDVGGGNREDLQDYIVNVSPMDTHALSRWEKRSARNIQHEWLIDSLHGFGDPDRGNLDVRATAEGSDATFDPLVPRKRLCNLTHIIRVTFDVSDTQRDINTAGIRDEYIYQLAKASKELARYIEFALWHSVRQVQTQQGNAAGVTPRKMDGFRAFIMSQDPTCVTTLDLLAREMGTVVTVNGNSPDDCIDECLLNEVLERIWDKGGMPDVMYMNSKQKRAFSNMVLNPNSNIRYNINVSEKTIVNTIDYVQTDFGTQKLLLSRYQPTDSIAIAEEDKLAVAVLRPVLAVELAKIGSSTKGMIEWEGTHVIDAPSTCGLIEGLCTGVPGCGPLDITVDG